MLNIPINLIRYLIILDINSSLVYMPRNQAAEISRVLGETIARRLPTSRARQWRKTLVQWDQFPEIKTKSKARLRVPENPWPIEAILFPYPIKRSYGQGERFFLELRLIGKDADHGLFMEEILPALEQLGTDPPPDKTANSLWGEYEIRSVYTAKGTHWKPLIKDGRLDLRYKVVPNHWAKGLKFSPPLHQQNHTLSWLSAFDLYPSSGRGPTPLPFQAQTQPPLKLLLDALGERLGHILVGKYPTADAVFDLLDAQDKNCFQEALATAEKIQLKKSGIEESPFWEPARWSGHLVFAENIAQNLLPLLGLAAILHVGRYTHYGCGGFTLAPTGRM